MHRFVRTLVVLAVLFAPVGALAQDSATIAGTVRDASGAVLPGVTVEAASSALIEKVRSVTSDGFASEPLTPYPRLVNSSAIPLMPMPPIPTKWIRRVRPSTLRAPAPCRR